MLMRIMIMIKNDKSADDEMTEECDWWDYIKEWDLIIADWLALKWFKSLLISLIMTDTLLLFCWWWWHRLHAWV